MYRAYIKDKLDINNKPKSFLDVKAFSIRRDLLSSANSDFDVISVPSNVNEGDLFVLYDDYGKVYYYGIVETIGSESISCTQIQSFYKGLWIYDTYPSASLEDEIAYLLGRFAQGYLKDCTWQDDLINQAKSPCTITTGSTTLAQLETLDKEKELDFEEFIYQLYDKYGIVFDFTIPYENGCSVEIKKASTTSIKISDNAECILDISPITEVEETNKLVIYAQDGTYRTTYVYTSTNGIVQEPSSIVGRLGVVNTKVLRSDDDLNVLKDSNITTDMFNHKVEFTMLIDNKLYDFWSMELGQPIKIYKDGKYFDSIFTGYEISAANNTKPTEVKLICGKVRTKLTSLLKMGVIK